MKRYFLIIFIALFAISCGTQTSTVDRSIRPAAGPAPEINFGTAETFTLDNGLTVFVVQNNKLPRIAYRLVLDHDPVVEGPFSGLGELSGEMLSRGTINRTKEEIDEEVDFIGATLRTSSTGMFASSLTRHNEQLLELFTDVLINPVFPDEELDRIKVPHRSALEAAKNDPSTIGRNVRRTVNYSRNHPYGEIMTEETLDRIAIEHIKSYYETFFRPNQAYLAIVGDITLEEARRQATDYFSNWEPGDVPAFEYETPQKPETTEIAFAHRDGAVQSNVSITYPLDLKPGTDDAIKARVVNHILGGGASSRLFVNLRETNAYTYGAYSSLSPDIHVGSFTAFADVRNEVTDSAIVEILNEMNRLRTERITEDELQKAKNNITGNFARSLENPQTIANFAINIHRYNLPEDYYTNYLRNLNALTVEDIYNAAQQFLHPENAYIVVVGNKDEVAEKLEQFSEREIRFYDHNGERVELTESMPVPEGVTAESVIKNYIQAIGGERKLKSIKDRTVVMTANIQGMPIQFTEKVKATGQYFLEVGSNGMVFEKMVYDGNRAQSSGMGGSNAIEGKELQRLKEQALLFAELKYLDKNSGYKIDLSSIETLNNREVYRIEVISPAGNRYLEFYDVNTGLKARSLSTMETEQGSVTQIAEFDDYREVNGIRYPHSVKQTVGPQSFDLKLQSLQFNTGLSEELFKVN